MLTQLVRPLVRTQIQVLATSKGVGGKLAGMISRWLGYLGVQAEVKQLQTKGLYIQVSLSVGKPEQCSEAEWKQILANLGASETRQPTGFELIYEMMTEAQQRQVSRLLAHMIQVGTSNALQQWESLQPQLSSLAMDDELLQQIRAALKVPQMLDSLLKNLEPEVAAFVLSRAIGIALMDREINADEDNALKNLYLVIANATSPSIPKKYSSLQSR